MSGTLYQWSYEIDGLIPRQVRLKRRLWLKKGEILLETKNEALRVHVLGNEDDRGEERITRYLWMACLISSNASTLSGGGGASLASPAELGKHLFLTTSWTMELPDVAVRDIAQHAPRFLKFIGKLHDKYIEVVEENDFLAIALDYFHDAENKFVYSNEGFISAMISMESLFNEDPSNIKYKLAHRAAFLLGLCDLDPFEAFEMLKKFYDNRSRLVHGGGTLKHDPDRYLVSRYTRRCLIVFLILLRNRARRNKNAKDRKFELLKEIDYAMLDENRRNTLSKEIRTGMKNFRLDVPRTFEGEGKNGRYRITAW